MIVTEHLLISLILLCATQIHFVKNEDPCFKISGSSQTTDNTIYAPTMTIFINAINKCNTPITLKDYSIELRNWKINGAIVRNAEFKLITGKWILNQFIMSDSNSLLLVLNTQPCPSYCSWAEISSQETYLIELITRPQNTKTITSFSFDGAFEVAQNTVTGTNPLPILGINYDLRLESFADSTLVASHPFTKIPNYIHRVLISYANPSMTYKKNDLSFKNTGIQSLTSFDTIKRAFQISKKINPDLKVILVVGGHYSWNLYNASSIIDLLEDLGFDGINIDFNNEPICSQNINEDITCSTDSLIIDIIKNLKPKLNNKLLVAIVNPVGAYALTSKSKPLTNFTGMWIKPLKAVNGLLDELYLTFFDIGASYDPKEGFAAYRNFTKAPIYFGVMTPPEAWGSHKISLDEITSLLNYVGDKTGGLYVVSAHKHNQAMDSNLIIKSACSTVKTLSPTLDCTQSILLN